MCLILRYWLLILCCLLPTPLCPLRCPPKASTLHSWQAQRGRVHAVALSPDETLVATAGPLLGPPGTGTGAGTGAGAGAKKGPAGVCVWSLRSCAEVARYTGAAASVCVGGSLHPGSGHLFVLVPMIELGTNCLHGMALMTRQPLRCTSLLNLMQLVQGTVESHTCAC